MLRTGIVYHEDYLKHDAGQGHPESPSRLMCLMTHLEKIGVLSELVLVKPSLADVNWICTIHDPNYVSEIEKACEARLTHLDMDTGINPESYRIARLAVGGALAAVDAVMQKRIRNAFCAIRPPGHHAERDRAMGFCLFNQIAIAARYVQGVYGLRRILIIDWDVHHGNGTQNAFYNDPSVFYFSIHQFPHYPGSGNRQERGSGEGLGTTLNVPLPAGAGDETYIKVFEEELIPAAKQFAPDFILISAGFDAHRSDPLAGMKLSETGYGRMTSLIKEFAMECCEGRVVSLLEGGYHLYSMAKSVEAHLRILME